MKQVIKFKSDREHYKADACIVWCFDNRFDGLLSKIKEDMNFEYTDDVEIAGGAMGLTGRGAVKADEVIDYIADQVSKSIKLHSTPLVVLMVHKDCGAYKALDLPPKGSDETEFLKEDLGEAKKELKKYLQRQGYFPEIKIYIADFDGLWEVE